MGNWDNLRFYLAVANTGTASAAAKQLNVSHATVLRRIEQIEKELGSRLFKKLQSGYELTQTGEQLLDETRNIENAITELERKFRDKDQQLEGQLCISQPENEVLDLYPLYAEFNRLHPEIRLQIVPSDQQQNLQQYFNRDEIDVAIRFIDSPPDLLVGRCLGSVKFGAYCSPDYLKKFDAQPELIDCDWILWRQGQMQWLYSQFKTPKVVMQTTSVSDVISAIRAGMGVGWLSRLAAQHYPELLEIPTTRHKGSYKLWLLTHRELRNSARVTTFMRFMATSLKEQLKPDRKL